MVTSIQVDKITTFDIELFVGNKKVPLIDNSNILAFITDRYRSELYKVFKKISRRYNPTIDELLNYLRFKTLSSREILLKDKLNNKLLLRSIINDREFVTFIDFNVNNQLFEIHNINICFMNAILHQKIKRFISNIKFASHLIRLLIISIMFLFTNILDPLQTLDLIIKEGIYSLIFVIYPFTRPISSFIIRKLLNYLIVRAIKRDR